jgi:hypothetical protein
VNLQLGAGSGNSEEGVTVAPAEDKNVMTTGADGQAMHTLVAATTGLLTFRFLKTSPINAKLQAMYDLQSSSSRFWGQNVIVVTNTGLGDYHSGQACAFKKKPEIVYDKAGAMIEWQFDVQSLVSVLGAS